MVRLASISLPRFDLQILAQRYPDWKEHPCGVVSEEKPLGRILEVNRAARSDGVRPGMRYASALAICPLLRVGVISDADRVGQSRIVMSILKEFSPEVEQSQHDAGLFWVDASGMERLFATTAKWAGALQIAVTERGFVCSVAVGFSRFGTYAAAKVKRAVTLFESEDQERAAALRAPVGVLPLDHETLLRFHQLGLYTIKDFVRFSAGALARRFGREVAELHSFASGLKAMPIQSSPEPDPLSREMRLLYPQAASEALVHHLSSLLHELVAQAWKRQELVSEITLTMHPESWPGSADDSVEEHLQVAQPTADHVRLERLLRLRLESLELPGPVVRLAVAISCVGSDREQSERSPPSLVTAGCRSRFLTTHTFPKSSSTGRQSSGSHPLGWVTRVRLGPRMMKVGAVWVRRICLRRSFGGSCMSLFLWARFRLSLPRPSGVGPTRFRAAGGLLPIGASTTTCTTRRGGCCGFSLMLWSEHGWCRE
ncbi:MAG: Y-family DNA polymerase [Spirochaetales bacterium]